MASASDVQGGFQRFVSAELTQALQKMGIFKPNAIQANAIPLALSGRDVMIVAQTGSGKTLMFLLPILQRLARAAAEEEGPWSGGPRAIVLVPTEELARQVAAVAEQLMAALPSTQRAVCVADASSTPAGALVVFTPEHLSQHLEGDSLDLEGLLALAIDEADAILLTREEAKGSADELLRKCEAHKEPPQLFLTMAHLTQVREEELVRRFPTVQRVGHTGVLVPTLRQCFHYFHSNKEQKLLDVLRSAERDTWLREGTTLVFCSQSETAECLCGLVDPSLKPQVLHEHAHVAEQRSVCEAFRKGDSRVLLATDNAARGLDFPLLRHVVLYDVPSDLTAFVHCAGRTARRGQRGLVTCLVQTHEASTYQFDFKNHHGLQPAEQLSFQREERPQERESPQERGQPNEERRCDPLDGQWCTLGELRRRYQPQYSEAEVLQYWRRECKPSSKGRWVPRQKQVTNGSSR